MSHARQIGFLALCGALAVGAFLYSRRALAAASGGPEASGGNPDSSGVGAASDGGSGSGITADWPSIADLGLPTLDQVIGFMGIAPKGIRNHNPGNLRTLPPSRAWDGQVGDDGNGYAVYSSDAYGVRALGHQLMAYSNRGLNTVREIITSWAPAADHNNTDAYIANVSTRLGVNPDDPIDVAGILPELALAIIWQENGQQPYNPDDIANWVYLP